MELMVPHLTEIWDEILSEKIIKKNKQYGNSVAVPAIQATAEQLLKPLKENGFIGK